MKTKFFCAAIDRPVLALLLAFLCILPGWSDPLESLIDQEKEEIQQWMEIEGELPAQVLFGDQSGAMLYAAWHEDGNLLCGPVEFDAFEGADRLRGPAGMTLNVSHPRVRDILGRATLMRPHDELMAIGAGWQKIVRVEEFRVKPARAYCPSDSPYALWLTFEPGLAQPPLFFSSDARLSEGANEFRRPAPLEKPSISDEIAGALETRIPFWREYEITRYDIDAPNCDFLLLLRREDVRMEDDGLPNEMLFWSKGDITELLAMETVDARKGSGHIDAPGVFDFNDDGNADLWIGGNHEGCVYRLLFEGKEHGFSPVPLLNTPCGC